MQKYLYKSVLLGLLFMHTSLFSVIVLNNQKIAEPISAYKGSVTRSPEKDGDFTDRYKISIPNTPGVYTRRIQNVVFKVVVQKDLYSNYFFPNNQVKVTVDYREAENKSIIFYHAFPISNLNAIGKSVFFSAKIATKEEKLFFGVSITEGNALETDVQLKQVKK